MGEVSSSSSSSSSSASESIMSALLSLPHRAFSDLVLSLSSDLRLLRSRLAFLLLSPPHFSLAISHLHTLSLPQKALLLSRLLLRHLQLLFPSLSSPLPHRLRLPDLDAALLLFAMCDSYDPTTNSHLDWHSRVKNHLLDSTLTPSGLGFTSWAVVSHYVDVAAKCERFLEVASGGKASTAAVVGLPSVESEGGGKECAVCKEEMERGRDVCELPCRHHFHWKCALGWLRKSNTCPCCRFELPAEDAVAEMGRVWRGMIRMGSGGGGGRKVIERIW
ncbi:E3 ubiquitin-protein ligase SGR9, amyloplastic-like [Typha latifolia]|uniref:E3 ubiquitin-protein ligase SGR9, amyloplastic-like n=1 Tax=Typha latifolia TaxID=4733 RepID=UPI003C2FD2CF